MKNKTAIKVIVIMFTVLASFSFINARPCGQIRLAHFINRIK